MDINDKWSSDLGFAIEIDNSSVILSGRFILGSVKHSLKGVGVGTSNKFELSFIITWDTESSTVFTGRMLEENLLSLDWLLFIEDRTTCKINTSQGNLVLTRYRTAPEFTEARQEKLPFPEILYNDLFPSKA